MYSIIYLLRRAWYNFCNYIPLSEEEKHGMCLLSAISDMLDHNADESRDCMDEQEYLNDPLWNFIHERIDMFPFSLRDAGAIVTAYADYIDPEKTAKRESVNILMSTLLRGASVPDAFKSAEPYSTEFNSFMERTGIVGSNAPSPMRDSFLKGDFNKVLCPILVHDVPSMIDAAIMQDRTGRLDKWFCQGKGAYKVRTIKVCPKCGNPRFDSSQRCIHDVVMDGEGNFVSDRGISDAEEPSKENFTCSSCGAEFSDIKELADARILDPVMPNMKYKVGDEVTIRQFGIHARVEYLLGSTGKGFKGGYLLEFPYNDENDTVNDTLTYREDELM